MINEVIELVCILNVNLHVNGGDDRMVVRGGAEVGQERRRGRKEVEEKR